MGRQPGPRDPTRARTGTPLRRHHRPPCRRARPARAAAAAPASSRPLTRRLLHSLLFFPARAIATTPATPFEDVALTTEDGERLHAWWVPALVPTRAHVLLCHGNAGNVGDRVAHVALLAAAGFDVLAFDYRGYGRSSGRPSEQGTYRDARAAREALLRRVDAERVVYLGESLGGAVALELALAHPPAGLVLQSAFTSVRDMARLHYPLIPRALVPDAYPSLRLIAGLTAPLLVVHGERDDIVPALHGEALYEAAPGPKQLALLPDVGHNDLIARAGERWADAIASWAAGTIPPWRATRSDPTTPPSAS